MQVFLDFSFFTGELSADILEKAFEDARISEEISILLLKTKTSSKNECSEHTGIKDYKSQDSEVSFQDRDAKQEKLIPADPAYLNESAAAWIVKKEFKAVGTDSLSIDNLYSEDLPVHHILLSNKVNIIEGLELNS